MTSFLRLNGIAVPVAVDSAELGQDEPGQGGRSDDGSPIFNRRWTKRVWSVRTTLRTSAEALAWRDLVTGKGHVLNWEDSVHYASSGLAPSSVQADFTISAVNPKYGTKRAASAATATNKASWPMFTSSSPWTVCLWDTTDGGATWHHYVVRSDGAKWVDGVRNDAASTTFLAVAAGVVTLGVTSVAHGFDDVVGFPQLMPTDWPAQIFGFGAAFGQIWKITADGLYIEQNASITVVGRPGKIKAVKAKLGGSLQLLQTFSFDLLEV